MHHVTGSTALYKVRGTRTRNGEGRVRNGEGEGEESTDLVERDRAGPACARAGAAALPPHGLPPRSQPWPAPCSPPSPRPTGWPAWAWPHHPAAGTPPTAVASPSIGAAAASRTLILDLAPRAGCGPPCVWHTARLRHAYGTHMAHIQALESRTSSAGLDTAGVTKLRHQSVSRGECHGVQTTWPRWGQHVCVRWTWSWSSTQRSAAT